MSTQTNQSASTTERGEKIVLLVLGGISEGIVHASEVTLSGEDFKDPSDFSGQTRKMEIQSGDKFFFFFFFSPAQSNYVAGAFTVRWIKQPEMWMKVASLQSKQPLGIMGKALMFQFFKHFPFRWTKLFQPALRCPHVQSLILLSFLTSVW